MTGREHGRILPRPTEAGIERETTRVVEPPELGPAAEGRGVGADDGWQPMATASPSTVPAPATGGDPERPARVHSHGSWVLAVGVVDFSLEQTILIPALPAIGARYHAGVAAVAWLVTGFLVSSAVSTPLAGRLGDRYGRRRVLLASLATFALGSVLCALGPSIGTLIAGRVVQGLGAGVGPLAFALLPDAVAPEHLSRSVGALIGAGGLGSVVGLLVAGPLVDHVGVPAIFWTLVVVAVGLGLAVALAVPESTIRSDTRVDWLGAALLSSFLATVVLAVSQGNDWGWTADSIVALLVGAVVSASLFVIRTRTATEPLLDPSSLRLPAVLGANVAVFVIGIALFGAYVLVPYIAGLPKSTGYGLGLSTSSIGFLLTPGSIGALVGGVVGGRLIERLGARRQAIVGAALTSLAYILFTLLPSTVVSLSVALIPLGFGIGIALVGIVEVLMLSVGRDGTGAAVGLNSVLRAVGAAIGSQAAVAILLASHPLAEGVPSHAGFVRAFVVGLVGSVGALVVMIMLPARTTDPVVALRRRA
jgi:MFS family permease